MGAGEVGYHIASKLSRENKDVVLIDRDEERLRQVAESLDVQTLTGSGSSPALLKEAGIKSADMIVAVTDSDETNLVACLSARIIAPGTTRIARIRNQEYFNMEEFRQEEVLGLSLVINPEVEVVKTIGRLLEVPGAVDVIDFADGLVRLIGLKIKADSPLVGHTMIDLRKRDPERHVLVAAIHHKERVTIPHGETQIEADDLVYVVTRPEEADDVLNFFGPRRKPAHGRGLTSPRPCAGFSSWAAARWARSWPRTWKPRGSASSSSTATRNAASAWGISFIKPWC